MARAVSPLTEWKMVRIKNLTIWLPLLISLVIVAAAVVLFLLIWAFGWGNTRTIYWLAYNATKNNWTAAALVIFLGSAVVYVCMEIVFRLFKFNRRVDRVVAASMFLIVLASMLLCGTGGVVWWQTGMFVYREHLETARLTDTVYHLHFYSYDAAEGYNDRYIIYECDSFDFLCRSIHSVPRTMGGIIPDVTTIHLLPDPATNTLALEINGEVVYTHSPST